MGAWGWIQRALRLAAGALAVLLAGSAMGSAAGAEASMPLTRAIILADGGQAPDRPPPAHASGPAVSLPDAWPSTRPGFGGVLWYRLSLPALALPAAGDLPAVAIVRACSALQVYFNGQLVHSTAPTSPPSALHCRQPLLIALPQSLWQPADNRLDLRLSGKALQSVAARSHAGGLSALQLGPLSTLNPAHARRTALQVSLPTALDATLVLMGGFLAVFGCVNRRARHLTTFGLLALIWAALDLPLWLHGLVPGVEAEWLKPLLLGAAGWAAVLFLLRSVGEPQGWVDRALPLQFGVLALSVALAGSDQLFTTVGFWQLVLGLEVAAAALWHLHRRRHRRDRWLSRGLLTGVGAAGLVQVASLGWDVDAAWQTLAQLSVPVCLALAGLRLIQLQGYAMNRAVTSQTVLERQLHEVSGEMERSFRQMSELRVEQITERERKRIAADLHDDLGAKLLTIVHTSDSERISSLAREALEEMRLSVRGLTGRPVRLADALGDWRAEVISRLAQASIQGDWEMPEDLPQTLSARAYVQTTRILREATSNIIRHSGATHCSVRAGLSEGDFQFVIQDNGHGIPEEVDGRLDRGHGLASMKQRARQLRGQCLIESAPAQGTVIRLTIPLGGAVENS